MLIGHPRDISRLTDSETSVHQHDVLLTFVVGLLCDPSNANFNRSFGSADNVQLNPRTFIEELEHKTEPLQLITLIHEAQCEDLVEIVPETIASRRLHPTEGMALASRYCSSRRARSPVSSKSYNVYISNYPNVMGDINFKTMAYI